MTYLGSPPASQAFAPGTDTFNGDGTTVAFTLSRNVSTVNDIQVVVNNVVQQPTAYSVATSTLTFTAAPSAGTANIYVRYLSTNLVTIAPQQGSVYPSSLSATGTPSSSTFYRGDNTWANPVSAGSIGIAQLSATGTPSSTTFLRGDNTWSTPASPSGSVIQVVSTTLTSAFSSATKAAWVSVTGLSASITPLSTSSRILIMVQVSTGDGGNNYPRTWAVARNGTLINQSTVGTGYVQGSFSSSLIGTSTGSNNAVQTIPFTFLDSPASTSAQTYQVQFNAYTSTVTTTYVNRSYAGGAGDPNCTSNIVLMEIA